jgi:hypothetical protein
VDVTTAPPEPDDPLLLSVIRLPELHDLVENAAESALDVLVNNDVIDVIPVVGSLRALTRGVVSWRDAHLTRKLIALLQGVGEVSERDRERWQQRLQDEDGLRDAGERLVALVDRMTSTFKAELVGLLVRRYLDGMISQTTLLRTVEVIDRVLTDDLDSFLRLGPEGVPEEVADRLISVGLMLDRTALMALESSRPPAASPDASELLAAFAARNTSPQ